MATVPNCYLVLKLSLLSFAFFALTTNAAPLPPDISGLLRAFGNDQQRKAIDFCEKMPDPNFCWINVGGKDQWGSVETYNGVFIIAVNEAMNQVEAGQVEITKVRPKYNGPIGKNRIAFCEKKYDYSAWNLNHARGMVRSKSDTNLVELSKTIYDALEGLGECEDEWKKNGPPQKSPLTNYYNNVNKLTLIMRYVINKMYNQKYF